MPHYNHVQRWVLGSAWEKSLSSTRSLQQQQYSKSLQTLYSFLVHVHIDQHDCSITHRVSELLEDLLASVTAFGPSESTNIHRQKLRGVGGRWEQTSELTLLFYPPLHIGNASRRILQVLAQNAEPAPVAQYFRFYFLTSLQP